MSYLISAGVFGSTPFIAHSKYDADFNNISIAFLLLSVKNTRPVRTAQKTPRATHTDQSNQTQDTSVLVTH